MSKEKDFIEKIRKEKYKIGSNTEDISLIKEDLQNAIKQLAEDLYADGVHFILELIQNADDNEYSDDIKEKKISFVIDEDNILVKNNEKGFNEENVKSLLRKRLCFK